MRGVRQVIHCATLHKPHVATHRYQDFVDTNISGSLNLLEAALAAGVESFVFTSTTSSSIRVNPRADLLRVGKTALRATSEAACGQRP